MPVSLQNCVKLKEIDLRQTFIISLPRELADLSHLVYLNLDECPTKDKLTRTYKEGMASIHTEFQRKNLRKVYKEQLFQDLTEWKYPSVDKKEVFEVIEDVFNACKDVDGKILKKLVRNFQLLFPVKFEDIDANIVRQKLENLHEESINREDIVEIQLLLRSNYLDEPLADVVKLATDIYHTFEQDGNKLLKRMLAKKHEVFKKSFAELTAADLLQNWSLYKQRLVKEREQAIKGLKAKILDNYEDLKISEEKIEEYNNSFVTVLKTTKNILEFTQKV